MTFNSLHYVFVFLPLTVVGYYLLRRTGLANLFLLACSLFFYAATAIWYLIPMLFTALIDYLLGQKIQDSSDPAYRKRLLIISRSQTLEYCLSLSTRDGSVRKWLLC